MHEVYRVGYLLRAWDPRSLQSILNDLLYFSILQHLLLEKRTTKTLESDNNMVFIKPKTSICDQH